MWTRMSLITRKFRHLLSLRPERIEHTSQSFRLQNSDNWQRRCIPTVSKNPLGILFADERWPGKLHRCCLPPAMDNRNFQEFVTLIYIAVSIVLAHSSAAAQETDPDALVGRIGPAALNATPPELGSATVQRVTPGATQGNGDIYWSPEIKFVRGEIYNPRTDTYDTVELRAYTDASTNPDNPFVAPLVQLPVGRTFRATLNNNLPADDPSCTRVTDPNKPHCFNSTNLHTHGLWISPSGNSDNVLLTIRPQVSFTYEYNIPIDHPAGTFWYHPHLHGSTAIQVASGMAGALIIRGDRYPTRDRNGDVDTLLRDPETGNAIAEQELLFQQIPYACRDESGKIKTDANGFWRCDPGDIGQVAGYDQMNPGDWGSSGRYTSINGRVLPKFGPFTAGKITRFRLIHAGVRDSIRLIFKKVEDGEVSARVFGVASDAELETLITQNCDGAEATQYSLATDGLTRRRLVPQTDTLLHPGYREDLLMLFPAPGLYCMIDGNAEDTDTVSANPKSRRLLGHVVVDGSGSVTDVEAALRQQLQEAAQKFIPRNTLPSISEDLAELKLTRFEPHASLMAVTPNSSQGLGFSILSGPRFVVGELDGNGKLLDPEPYKPGRIDRNLKLGAVEDWNLRSFFFGHPFHIHVNPFQVIEVLNSAGEDVSGYEPGNVSPYARLKGTWKDTLFVTQERLATGNRVPYRIKVRTHYRRYIGDFVLHCHILDHEDQGMMQNVRISLPDGLGGLVASHH